MIKVTQELDTKTLTVLLKEVQKLPHDLEESINEVDKLLLLHYYHEINYDYRGHNRLYLIIDTKDKVIGFVKLGFDSHNSSEAGINGLYIKKENRSEGYAPLVMKGIIKYLFDYESYEVIRSNAVSFNKESIKLQSMNFTKEGEKRHSIYWKNKWYNTVNFSLLREEYNVKVKGGVDFDFDIV